MSRNVEIVEFWGGCQLDKPPFVHPDDVPVLKSRFGDLAKDLARSFDDFVASARFGQFGDKNFHFSLYPHPFAGDLSRADIFLLQLNPGMNLADYHVEWNGPAFRSIMTRNIRQNLEGVEFPFWPLDPKLCGTTGFRWWESKLRDVCTIIAQKKYNGRYLEALRELSRRLAVIELVPYHSIAFDSGSLIRELPSAKAAIRFVTNDLLKRVRSGRALIVAVRGIKDWGLSGPNIKGVVAYSGGLTRGSSLSSRTPGGKAILDYLGVDYQ
jgi:hypothetical protein